MTFSAGPGAATPPKRPAVWPTRQRDDGDNGDNGDDA
jgi:hypothetical protein